jgi:hypothetical protein
MNPTKRTGRLFAIFLLASCLNKVSAQIQFGIKGGFNLADIPYAAEAYTTHKYLSAFNAGVVAAYPVSTHLLLQSEIVYSVQGTTDIYHATLEDETITSTYNYLNLPLLLKYSHHSGLFVETGPQLGIFLNGKTVYGNSGQTNANSYIQPIDIGWVFGLGYKIPGINIGLDARYNLGFANIDKYKYPNESPDFNRVFQLDLFYFFGKL